MDGSEHEWYQHYNDNNDNTGRRLLYLLDLEDGSTPQMWFSKARSHTQESMALVPSTFKWDTAPGIGMSSNHHGVFLGLGNPMSMLWTGCIKLSLQRLIAVADQVLHAATGQKFQNKKKRIHWLLEKVYQSSSRSEMQDS